ncbi:MAG: ATP-binding cassette domain-containing protein [Candidatus Heimdallarchaeota archaeon]
MTNEIRTKKFNVSHSFKTQSEVTDRTILVADAFGLGIDDEKDFCIYDNFEFDLKSNDIVYVTGTSGSGKSWILKNTFNKFKGSISIDDIDIDDNEILIEGVGSDLNDALKKLNLAGLGDAFLYLRKYSQLSDGQKYRYAIAKFLDTDKDIWILDEFCAKLDRVTAKIVAYNLQKIARRLNKCVICATTHTDLKDALKPSLHIEKGYESEVKYSRHEISEFSEKIDDIYNDIKVDLGDKKDYEKLKKFHYRQAGLGAVKNIYKLTLTDELIGVIVVTYPHLALKGRNIFNNKKYTKMTKENCTAINNEYECIARVILAPTYRGLGLAYYMLKEYFKLSACPYIETVAVMSKYSPFFERAGMTYIPVKDDEKRMNMIKQLEQYGFDLNLIASTRYNESIFNKLTDEEQLEVQSIVLKILNRYKGQISKLFSKDKSLSDIIEENLFDVMKEIKRADVRYWIWENKK